MSVLPNVSDKQALTYEYFPTLWQAIVWRNWGYVPAERIAAALNTTCENVRKAAGELGLNPELDANPVWDKRGFLTVIRDNWHLCTYEQLLTLLNTTEERLAFILKEDDFMWIKLGEFKPCVEKAEHAPLTEEQQERTAEIAKTIASLCPVSDSAKDNAFAFLEEFQTPLNGKEQVEVEKMDGVIAFEDGLRMIYPYFALYGDALLDESIDPFPERLLYEYSKAGINGIWMQGVLYQLVEFPFEPSMSVGWEKRIETLNKFVARAKKFGIGIYLYLNEPRAMADAFFDKYPHLRGQQEGDFYTMCTSTKEVQDYLYEGMKKLFVMVPDLAGFFTITMSENLTNCYSRPFEEMTCPRCKERSPWEIIAEVNNLMARGAHDANPNAKAIAWAWGWADDWSQKVVPLLTEGQILQCTSEEAMRYCIGGVEGSVLEYTMSLCGPGEKAKTMWKVARDCGMEMSAKVQMNDTWEMSVVPFIPVFDKVAKHISNLKEQGISHLQMSWTLGGCPSPNLKLAKWLMEEKGSVKEFLCDWLGKEMGAAVNEAQAKLSEAFSEYPFYIGTLYFGPQNFGPMAPFFLKETGYVATMVGYPYDCISYWSGIYSADIYESQYQKLCSGWREGTELLMKLEGHSEELDEVIFMAKAVLAQYESAYHHIQFVNRRAEGDTETMLAVVRAEIATVQEVIRLRLVDSRFGYESSNHYFYTLQDLKEKLINLAWCEEQLLHTGTACEK